MEKTIETKTIEHGLAYVYRVTADSVGKIHDELSQLGDVQHIDECWYLFSDVPTAPTMDGCIFTPAAGLQAIEWQEADGCYFRDRDGAPHNLRHRFTFEQAEAEHEYSIVEEEFWT